MTKFDHLYHYTDAATAKEIAKSRTIKAFAQQIYFDLIPNPRRSITIGPIIWLTINPILDSTVLAKLALAGREGELSQIKLPYVSDVGLGDFVDAKKLNPQHFSPLVETGRLAGSDYTCWRIVEGDLHLTEFETSLSLGWLKS
jgi:hypothetical protein